MNDRQICLKKKQQQQQTERAASGGGCWKQSCRGQLYAVSCSTAFIDEPRAEPGDREGQAGKARAILLPLCRQQCSEGDRRVNSLFHTDFRLVLTFRDGRWQKVWNKWSFSYVIPFISQERKDKSETNMENHHNLTLSAECTAAYLLHDFPSF